MIYAEVYVNPEPWAPRAVFVGVIAQNSDGGAIESKLAGARSIRFLDDREIDLPGQNIEKRELVATAKAFFASLDRLTHAADGQGKPASIAEVLRHIPDRGTSIQISAPRSGEFANVKKALAFCLASHRAG